MSSTSSPFEDDDFELLPDPDEVPIRDRTLRTQQYDLVVEALIAQIKGGTIFLRPLSERPNFQRRYVWPPKIASRLIESILLNVPVPPCYLSQNEEFELDVIDGQQRLYTIYRFVENQFPLSDLEVLTELNGLRFFELSGRLQRQISTHTLRCVLITNESHPEIKFDVFERLNTNTMPLNAQELRNCIYRGPLNELLHEVVSQPEWLSILGRRQVDKRMRDEELALRFFAFRLGGVSSYRTPQKHWLNDAAKQGRTLPRKKIAELEERWTLAISNSLIWFKPAECFRRLDHGGKRPVNRALFDLIMLTASDMDGKQAAAIQREFRRQYANLLKNPEFSDLISRSVDHKKRTQRRFEMWADVFSRI